MNPRRTVANKMGGLISFMLNILYSSYNIVWNGTSKSVRLPLLMS